MKLASEVLSKLPDFQAWRSKSADFDLVDYVSCVATPDLLFGFVALLFPELLLHESNYFLASHFDPATYKDWIARLHDPILVQKVMNHVHVSTLFQQQDVPDSVAVEAARQIAHCWSQVFKDIDLIAEASGNTLSDAEVTLFRKK